MLAVMFYSSRNLELNSLASVLREISILRWSLIDCREAKSIVVK